ncbi:PREDICTED: uncharacterized protein LOC107192945 [Dufourea novaeangliae]|uniref:uncharacterized protein LOC107192945 n=1 Tax=Dufourea novaeangliae TaxID=178035 RepID=UPI000767AD7A|nr:PREDICTED: uncharacterized protein LOC107192945 [Dufourea novaeangliae]
MSGKLRGGRTSITWDSSTDEDDDTYESKYKLRLRDSLRNQQQSHVSENETPLETRKRGRGPSKRPCLNRNALMARENRLRKKAYVEKIENKLSFYQQENKNLISVIRKQGIDIKRLSTEVAYLRSVLNNNTSLSALLKTINEGLQKMSTQKNNSLYPNRGSEYPNDLGTHHKCTCYTNVKENILNAQNSNIFITNVNNDVLTEQDATESQINECQTNTKKPIAFDTRSSPKKKDMLNTTTESISEDCYMDSTKDLDSLLPINQIDLSSISNIVEKKDTDAIGIDFDQLSSFNMDIFEDLPKCDEMMNAVDDLNDTTNLFTEGQIAGSTDNCGICLHVNSDRISLEFCSICHLNSKNSGSQ